MAQRRIVTEEPESKLLSRLLDKALGGIPPLSSAESLATEYLTDQSYASHDERVASLVKRETTKNFATGFLTGLGGVITLPVGVPAALGASWLIQARMAGAIARIYGHDLNDGRVRTMILLSLAGDVAREAMEDLGIDLGGKLPNRVIKQVPGRALVEINKRIGMAAAHQCGQPQYFEVSKVDSRGWRRRWGRVRCGRLPHGRARGQVFRPPSGESVDRRDYDRWEVARVDMIWQGCLSNAGEQQVQGVEDRLAVAVTDRR